MRPSSFLTLVALAWPAAAIAQTVTLQNDSFTSGGAANYQGGFVAGEMGASRFVPTGTPPYRLTKVRFLYGPSVLSNQINLHVYDDSAGTDSPGTEFQLINNSFQADGSPSAFVEIDLTTEAIDLTGPFRVAVEFSADGDPSIASDTDGTIAADKNYIFAMPGGWIRSSSAGVSGDWIIRADVVPNGGGVDAGPDAGPPDAGPGADAGGDAGGGIDAGVDAGGVDGGGGRDAGVVPCMVTSECPTGQYCLNKTSCTYDCRIDADCGSNMRCTSSGQCESTAASSGCSQGAGDGTVASVIGMLGSLLIWRRGRQRRS